MVTRTPRPAPRSRLRREERREQILDATKRIVGEHGLHSVSIERVAREAGITRPLVYAHFADLPGLLRALLDREDGRATAQIAALLSQALEGRDAIEAALEGYLRAVRDDPITWRIALMPPEGAPEFVRERIEQSRTAIVGRMAELVSPAFAPPGEHGAPDPELTAWSLSALADHWARLLLSDPDHFTAERLLAHARWVLGRLASA